MPTGIVKWFSPAKGYGFLEQPGLDADVFVHVSDVELAGLSTLSPGQRVSFEIGANQKNGGRPKATNIALAADDAGEVG